jgi:PAS domain-containing protein
MLDTALLVPWEPRWQASLGLIALTGFCVGVLHGAIDGSDPGKWIIFLAPTAFAVSFSVLKKYYRNQMFLIADLRAEVAHRETAQRLAQQGEHTLRNIIHASPDVIVIFEVRAGRLMYVNKAFERFGFSRDEAIGKTNDELRIWG